MRLEPEAAREICDRAGLRGRTREVLELLAQGAPAEEIAARLGMAVATVHVHAHRARKRIRAAQEHHSLRGEREFHRFVLHEAMPGPTTEGEPPAPLFRVKGPGYGERVRLNGGALVRVEDLLQGEG